MCGFVGLVATSAGGRADAALLRRLLGSLRARGPDGEGTYAEGRMGLAASRLAVRGDGRGAQPLRSGDGRFVVAWNGEILGPAEDRLRRLVQAAGVPPPPADAGDGRLVAEAVAALARAPGGVTSVRLAELLEGSMGALAVLDRERTVAWLARDRLGVKPVHVLRADGALLFASTIRPLLEAVPAARTADPEGLGELLACQRPVRTLPFAGIEVLPPGAVWRVDARGHVTRSAGGQGIRDLVDGGRLPPADAVRALADALEASARAAAGVDGPLAVFLSGGLDSSGVAVLAGRPDALALTGRFAPPGGALDESAQAALVAAQAGMRHEVLDLADEDLLTDLPSVVAALEVPAMGPGALALFRLARRARAHAKVVLAGTGGDELLGGYARTALALGRGGAWTVGYESLAARIDAAGEDLGARRRVSADRSDDLAPLLAPEFLATLPAPELPSADVRAGDASGATELLVRDEVEGTLPWLLFVDDRTTMAHGLEARPPFCLGGVPAAAARVPPDWLVGPDGEGKRALRAALEGRVPERVRLDRRKRGLPTPFARAVRGAGRAAAEAVVADRRFRERGWWNVAACRAALLAERPLHDRALYAMLSWELWARAFLDGDALLSEVPA